MTLRETFARSWDVAVKRAGMVAVVQDKEELFALICLLQAAECTSYLELGSSDGVSLFVIGSCLPKGARIACVDLFEAHSAANLQTHIGLLQAAGQQVTKYEGKTEAWAKMVWREHPDGFDAVLIDAGKRYKDVKRDWEDYHQMARKLVAIHDVGAPDKKCFWTETHGGLEVKTTLSRMGYGVRWVA
jgi:predicted O-methyltransferase YrrM